MNLTVNIGRLHDGGYNNAAELSDSGTIMDYGASNNSDLMESWGYTGSAIVLGINGFLGFTLNISVIVLMCKDMQVKCVRRLARVLCCCCWACLTSVVQFAFCVRSCHIPPHPTAVESDQHYSIQSGVLGFHRIGAGQSVHNDRGHLPPVDIRPDVVRVLRVLHGTAGHCVDYHANGALVRAPVHRQVSVHHQAAEQSRRHRLGAVHLDVLAGSDYAAALRLGSVRE